MPGAEKGVLRKCLSISVSKEELTIDITERASFTAVSFILECSVGFTQCKFT